MFSLGSCTKFSAFVGMRILSNNGSHNNEHFFSHFELTPVEKGSQVSKWKHSGDSQ